MQQLLLGGDTKVRKQLFVRRRYLGFTNVLREACLRVETENGVWMQCMFPHSCAGQPSLPMHGT